MCWTSTKRGLPRVGDKVAVITHTGAIMGAELLEYSTELFALDDGTSAQVAFWEYARLALESVKAKPAPAGGEARP